MSVNGGPAPVEWASLVGKRLLLQRSGALWVYEAILHEVSPSGEYLRFDMMWERVGAVMLIGVLPPVAETKAGDDLA